MQRAGSAGGSVESTGARALLARVRDAGAPGANRLALVRSVGALVRSGRFDVEFYAAQAGREFPDAAAAARHYLTAGRYDDLSPHPLFDPTAWAGDARVRHAAPRAPFPAFLAAGPAGARRASALFDAAAHAATRPGPSARVGAWADFLDTATPDTPLPGPPGVAADGSTVTWGALRTVLLRAARTAGAQRRAAEPDRLAESWDTAAGAALAAEARAAGVPAPVPGRPLVTVVIPVRNRPHQVLQAIASVVGQTLADWEAVVVDDGSTDTTPDAVAAVAAAEPRVRLLRRPHEGVSAARNAAARTSAGRYVAWLDSDTVWEPDFLRVALSVMAARGLGASHAVQEFIAADGTRRFRAFDGDLVDLAVGNFVDLNTLVVTRDLLDRVGGFDPGLRRAVDYDLVLRIAAVERPVLLPVLASVYRDDTTDRTRIGVRELRTWNYVVRQRQLLDLPALRAGVPDRVRGRVSILVAARNQGPALERTVAAVLAEPGRDSEIVVVDLASHVPHTLRTAALELRGPGRVRVVRAPVNVNTGVGLNLALAASTGAVVAVVTAGARPSGAQLDTLVDLLDPAGGPRACAVAPLVVTAGGAVLSAGTAFAPGGSLPVPVLEGLLPADADRLSAARGGVVLVPAATREVVVLRAADMVAVDGFDPLFVDGPDDADLLLRIAARTGEPVRVATGVPVVADRRAPQTPGEVASGNRRTFLARWTASLAGGALPALGAGLDSWADAGLELVGFAAVPDTTGDVAAHVPVLRLPAGPRPLRWVVDTSGLLPDRPEQDRWRADAAELAASLRDVGQDSAVRAPGSPETPTGTVDVVVAGAGRRPARPTPGVVNVLWLPDGVPVAGAQDAVGFDIVLAADTAAASELAVAAADDAVRFVPFPAAVAGTPPPGVPVVLTSPLGGADTVPGLPPDARPLVAEVARIRAGRTRATGTGSW